MVLPCKNGPISFSMLRTAVLSNDTTTIRLLLACPGINVNGRDAHGFTILTRVINPNTPVETVRIILDCGKIRLDTFRNDGRPDLYLHDAIRSNRVDIVALLLGDNRMNIYQQDEDGRTALDLEINNNATDALRAHLNIPPPSPISFLRP